MVGRKLIRLRLALLVVLLSTTAGAAIGPTVDVGASGGPQAPPGSHYGGVGPMRLVQVRDLKAQHAAAHPHLSIPFLPRDPKAYAAEKQLVLDGKAGRRQGVVNVPTGGPRVPQAPQTDQKLVGFPLMSLQQQVGLFGFQQSTEPPDTQLAAGPTDLVEADNSTLSIWSKSGSLVTPIDLYVFFGVPSGVNFSDPRILFDDESGRWFLTGLAFDTSNNSEVVIAVSRTADPTGAWEIYPVAPARGVLHDQPMVGVNSDKVVISWNDYTGTSLNNSVFSGAATWVLQKSDLLAGASVPRSFAFAPDPNRFRIVPAQSMSATSTAWLAFNNANCVEGCTTGSPAVGVIAVTGTPALHNVVGTESDPAIRAIIAPPNPRQPSGVPVDVAIDDRFLSAVWQNGALWVSGTDACIPAGDAVMRSCLRLVEVSTGAAPTVSQDLDGGSNGLDGYYPAVTVDSSGNLFVAFTESSPSEFPTAASTAIRVATPGTFENEITLAPGLASYRFAIAVPQRWGDYSGAARDPSNPAAVWLTAEYQASLTDPGDWGTATARVIIQPPSSAFTATTPQRLLDTRVTGGRLGPGRSLSLIVAGGNTGVPANASAVIMNVTVTKTTASSFLTVYPAGSVRPLASSLNWVSGQTVPNLVEVPVGVNNQVTFYNAAGSTDLVVDLEGYFAPPNGLAGQFQPLAPTRILDTRTGNGAPAAKVGSANTLNLQVTGRGGVPSSGVSAVVMNVTATNPSTAGFLTVFPAGAPQPLASNLNFTAGETVPNRVVVGVGAGGQVSIFNGQGLTNVIADVGGYFTDSSASGQLFSPIAPVRLLDTRAPKKTLGPGRSLDLSMTQASVPATATAVILNVTVTDTTASSFLTVYPAGTGRPLASDLNWVAGKTVPNLVVVALGGGSVTLYNQAGSADVIVDILGYFSQLGGTVGGSVSASRSSIPADGSSTATVTATLIGSDGTPLANDSVTFTPMGGASCGTISGSPATTNAAGNATVTYTASTTPGTCIITATEAIGNTSASTSITQTVIANTIVVAANPSSVPADGTSTSIVTATVTGSTAAGDLVAFTMTPSVAGACGTLSASSTMTNGVGVASVTYTASVTAGTCSLAATEASTGSSGTTVITQT